MALEPLNALFGAGIALIAKEAVDARNAKKQLQARDDAALREVKQELIQIRGMTIRNLISLWDRNNLKFRHRHIAHWETEVDPLFPLPARLNELMRKDDSYDLLKNRQVISLLSNIMTVVTYANLLDAQRMRYIGAQYRARVVYPASGEEVAERVERWERRLLDLLRQLLTLVLRALAVIAVVESDRMRFRKRRIRFGSFYEPDEHDWYALHRLAEADADLLGHDSGHTGHDSRYSVLKEFGLAEKDGLDYRITARGRIMAGSGEKYWHRPQSTDPDEERIDWSAFDPMDAHDWL